MFYNLHLQRFIETWRNEEFQADYQLSIKIIIAVLAMQAALEATNQSHLPNLILRSRITMTWEQNLQLKCKINHKMHRNPNKFHINFNIGFHFCRPHLHPISFIQDLNLCPNKAPDILNLLLHKCIKIICMIASIWILLVWLLHHQLQY